MLLLEKIEAIHFSAAEQQVIDYIKENSSLLRTQTIKELSQATYVHPSTFIRIAKKIGFSGWSEFKETYLQEQQYLNRHFNEIDANLPFQTNDDFLTIAHKIATLERMTIEDTFSLLTPEVLQLATSLLDQSKEIKIFTSNANLFFSQDFALKMRRLKKPTSLAEILGEQMYEADSSDEQTCAVLISYTGENHLVKQLLPVLKKRGCKIISLTSIGESTISQASDCNLAMTTRERLYSKIGNFTTSTSISYLLDVLYSAYFSLAYQKNLTHLIEMGQAFDKRQSTSPVMVEAQQVERFIKK